VKWTAPTEIRQKADLRDYLAAERTLLHGFAQVWPWMGFGFVVARFGFSPRASGRSARSLATVFGLSLWFGTALIAMGV